MTAFHNTNADGLKTEIQSSDPILASVALLSACGSAYTCEHIFSSTRAILISQRSDLTSANFLIHESYSTEKPPNICTVSHT